MAGLGYHARADVHRGEGSGRRPLDECGSVAYDFDEPDLIKLFESLRPRLRAVLDHAPLHTGPTALEVQTHTRLVASAGLYDQVFSRAFADMSGFVKTPPAGKWFDIPKQLGVPPMSGISRRIPAVACRWTRLWPPSTARSRRSCSR